MRIFSIHKSKSKKQVSEKTPKLAAKKFLEKRKVGTVIYLHEHPSGKIHGPYQKENNKNVMKGGLFGSPSVSDFLVPSSNAKVLKGTKQLLINRPRSFFTREPYIYFGDNTVYKKYGNPYNRTENINYYYSYVLINNTDNYSSNQNISTQLKLFELDYNENVDVKEWNVVQTNINTLQTINSEILLGLYIQYISRCMMDFPNSQNIDYKKLYMRRLFLHLLIHVLPIITEYIMNKYFSGKINYEINKAIDECKNLFNQKTAKEEYYELYYFMIIASYIQNINIESLVNEIANKYNTDKLRKQEMINKGKQLMETIKIQAQTQNQTRNQTQAQTIQSIMNKIGQADEAQQKTIHGIPEKTSYYGATGSLTGDIALGIVLSPFIAAGLVLAGLNELIKMFKQQNNLSRTVN